MPADTAHQPPRARLATGIALALVVAVTAWAFRDVFVSPASRACMALYRAARTAADTAAADHTIPEQAPRTPEARSCGNIRQFARWF